MVEKLQVLGKEIVLPAPMEITRQNILSILRDCDAETARELESIEFSLRIEQNIAVVYRIGATMG